ncbi:hypothetical protein ES288_A09G132700v1 [Gossypium darwinii]|uniref:Uncharacterized protein n=1 Tax=Gossypium darwinii TaxID=34276 RepID=A0A5D2F8A0_GOSDA|nr:hypothetical protein ES288_A09G132700v1 [Gossypium darwinii]
MNKYKKNKGMGATGGAGDGGWCQRKVGRWLGFFSLLENV